MYSNDFPHAKRFSWNWFWCKSVDIISIVFKSSNIEHTEFGLLGLYWSITALAHCACYLKIQNIWLAHNFNGSVHALGNSNAGQKPKWWLLNQPRLRWRSFSSRLESSVLRYWKQFTVSWIMSAVPVALNISRNMLRTFKYFTCPICYTLFLFNFYCILSLHYKYIYHFLDKQNIWPQYWNVLYKVTCEEYKKKTQCELRLSKYVYLQYNVNHNRKIIIKIVQKYNFKIYSISNSYM